MTRGKNGKREREREKEKEKEKGTHTYTLRETSRWRNPFWMNTENNWMRGERERETCQQILQLKMSIVAYDLQKGVQSDAVRGKKAKQIERMCVCVCVLYVCESVNSQIIVQRRKESLMEQARKFDQRTEPCNSNVLAFSCALHPVRVCPKLNH